MHQVDPQARLLSATVKWTNMGRWHHSGTVFNLHLVFVTNATVIMRFPKPPSWFWFWCNASCSLRFSSELPSFFFHFFAL